MKWEPIDTAPKDGREIIVYGTKHGTYGYTPDELGWTGARYDSIYGKWHCSVSGRYANGFTPTHWIPLPEPPYK